MRRSVFAVCLVAVSVFSSSCSGLLEHRAGANPPRITHSYAVDKGAYGETWKFYIEAEDPEGDMIKITYALEQEGVRYEHPVDFVFIKQKYQTSLKGFLSLETTFLREPSMGGSPRLALRVSIFDKAGHESNEAVFRFEFAGRSQPVSPLPAPFDQGDIPKLGTILVEGKYPRGPSQ